MLYFKLKKEAHVTATRNNFTAQVKINNKVGKLIHTTKRIGTEII